MKQIVSKYSYLFKSSDNKYLIYNSQTNSFIEVYKDLFDSLKNLKRYPNTDLLGIDEESIVLLKKCKILVRQEEDDSYFYKEKLTSYMRFFSQKVLSLTLVPTTGCNFDCSYCFESSKKNKNMSPEIIEGLFSFIKDHEHAEILNLTWYGGEPLMVFKTIKKILCKIKTKTNLEIKNHAIITNGYYFNQEICDFFKEYPLNFIQITLDGNKESHDQKRKMKGTGSPTYEKIIQNIDLITKELPDTRLAIRVNVDKQNKDSYYGVYTDLKQLLDNKNVDIYPGFIRIDDETHKKLGCESLLSKDISNLYFDLSDKLDINIRFYPKLIRKGCTANSINAYIIGPSGEIYKCWNDVSNPDKIVGYINQKNITNIDLLSKYLVGSSCFEDKKCKDCFFLPICSGGCAWYRTKNFFEKGEYNLCSLYKDKTTFNKCLEFFYKNGHDKKYQLNFS